MDQTIEEQIKSALAAQEEVRNNPGQYFKECLGFEPWDKQIEIIEALKSSRKVSVRSCNGAGKTYLLPRIAMWYLASFTPSMVINTAPTWRQVENQYWRHFRKAHNSAIQPLGGSLLKTKFEIDEDWYAMGISVKKTEDFQGWHNPNILVIIDESSGVSPVIFEAVNGIISGGENTKLLLIGNPNQNQGDFYDSFTDPTFAHVHISAYDLPNVKEKRHVIPGLSTWEWIEDMKKKYGEDHDVFRIRVKGEPPVKGTDILIPVSLVADAIDSDREEYGEDEVIGLDVARFGDDNSAFVYRKGNKAKVLEVIPDNDLMELAGKSKKYLKEYPKAVLNIDLGMGAGVYDRLKEQDDVASRIYGSNFGGEPTDKEEYLNMRAEAYDTAKHWLKDGILEKHEDWYQLCKPKYKITSKGQLQLESKADMKKRGVPSPDVGDAFVLTLSRRAEGHENLGIVWL